MNKLKIVAVEASRPKEAPSSQASWKQQQRAYWERAWLERPELFDPERSALSRAALEKTWSLLLRHVQLEGAHVIDLGCGRGLLAQRMADAGAHVTACDISNNALKELRALKHERINCRQETLPTVDVDDAAFDLVLCTEVIAELPSRQRRHLLAEFYRLVKPGGRVVVSSSLDVYGRGAWGGFWSLARTELDLVDAHIAYHGWSIRLRDGLERLGARAIAGKWAQSDRGIQRLESLCRLATRGRSPSFACLVGQRRKVFQG
jgi:SAM-dependent methyltransferase